MIDKRFSFLFSSYVRIGYIFTPRKKHFSVAIFTAVPSLLHPSTPRPLPPNLTSARSLSLSLSSSLSLSERSGAVEIALRIALSWKGMRMIKVLLLLPLLLALFRVCGLILWKECDPCGTMVCPRCRRRHLHCAGGGVGQPRDRII